MPIKNPTKRCRDCGKHQPVTEYWKSSRTKSGLAAYCIPCCKLRNRVEHERATRRHKVTVTEKFCYDCKLIRPAGNFTVNNACKDGLDHFCRACKKERHRKWAANPATWPLRKAIWAKSKYGISPEDYQAMVDAQAGKCEICKGEMGPRPHIDHDHITGAVRDLLCSGCNSKLAGFEQPEFPEKAIAYLEKHKAIQAEKERQQSGFNFSGATIRY